MINAAKLGSIQIIMLEIVRLNSNTSQTCLYCYVHEVSKNSIHYILPVNAIFVTSKIIKILISTRKQNTQVAHIITHK